MPATPEKRRLLERALKVREATCGACGCTEELNTLMRQFTARPDQDTDMFYCGCQDDHDDRHGGTW